MEDGLNISLLENVFECPDDLFFNLENEVVYLPPEQSRICVKGKIYDIPRKIAAFGDSGLCYTFSGVTVTSLPWTPLLLQIKETIEKLTGVDFNFALINRYEDGDACIGQHKDDEPDLEENHPICSFSLGETRTMIFKRPNFKEKRIDLKSNSVLVMRSPTNRFLTHGIPGQKKRTGVRINLTFRKMKTAHNSNNNKRKPEEEMTAGNPKRVSQEKFNDLVFMEGHYPEGIFPIGDSVFVYASAFKGSVLVHIRRFKKFGEKYYPTKEGIALHPACIDTLIKRGRVPESPQDLMCGNCFYMEEDIKVVSTDFENFTFTRCFKKNCSRITITSTQWREILNQFDDIAAAYLNYIFECMDFTKAYMSFEERDIDNRLPESLDISLGTQCLLDLLRNSLSDCIKEKRGLKDPQSLAEELWANRVQTFNSVALHVNVQEVAETFYSRIWERKDYLALERPANYLTKSFLTNIRFQDVLKEVRNVLCPANAFEFFEDFE